MDFTFSDEQRMFQETAQTLLGDTCAPEHLRQLLASGQPREESRWNAIVETGLTLVLLPEAAGGIGLSEIDFLAIAEAAGYAGLPEPLVESAGVAAPLLAAAGAGADILADPTATIAIQHPINPFVADADTAAAIILVDGADIHLVEREDVTLTRQESIDPFRRLYTVEWDPAKAQPLGAVDWELALDRGALFAAAQGLGLAQRAVDLAVEYAKERQQFGKPIGTYQAVKHHLSSAQVAIEFARPVVLAAAADLAHGDVQSRARISHAKLVALEAADQAARASIQVHGAMGYSWEVDVHLFLKRTLALTSSWGTPYFHRQRIMHRIAAQPLGPDQTFARETVHARSIHS